MENWLNKIENFHPSNIELGLDRIRRVAAKLNLLNPNCPVITVAGTNGKGTCCTKLSRIYTDAEYKVGCYTSPHLIHFNERIMLNHEPVQDEMLIKAFEKIEAACEDSQLTFFEFSTLSALLIFKQANLDIMILEVGLGGRLDAVNIIDPDVAVITSIDLDHQHWLGTDRESIGAEKAGIMRTSRPVFVSDINPPISLQDYADTMGAEMKTVTETKLVPAIIECMSPQLPINSEALEHSLASHQLKGRLHIHQENPRVILDVAHNPAATQRLAHFLAQNSATGKTYAVVSLLKDKDRPATLTPMLKHVHAWHTCDTEGPRGARAQDITDTLTQLNTHTVHTHDTLENAYAAALEHAQPEDQIIVFGSFQTVGGVLKLAP